MKKFSHDEVINKFISIHGLLYDYSLVEYVNVNTKVDIICKKHGIFRKTPKHHILRKQGCPRCSLIKNTDDFVSKAYLIYGNKYDYSKVNYVGTKTPVEIICKEHGLFLTKPNNFLNGNSCPKCGIILKNKKNTSNTIEFINKSNNIHNNTYNYDKTIYVSATKKVIITCNKHGDFYQTPQSHLKGCGCIKCSLSKFERYIICFLDKINVEYSYQKKFDKCKNKNFLPFDFYLPKYNVCIEYDGIQHFEPVVGWGGIKRLNIIKKNDMIKNEFCKENNINLLRIRYDEKDIDNKILNYINNI